MLLYGRGNLSVLIGSFLVRVLPYRPFPWKWSSAVYFLFLKARKFKTSMARVPCNKLLTNLASSSLTGEYWPLVVFVQTSLPRPWANIPQYCSCAFFSERLIFTSVLCVFIHTVNPSGSIFDKRTKENFVL